MERSEIHRSVCRLIRSVFVDGLDRGRPMVRGPALVDFAALNPPYGQPEAINALIDIRILWRYLRV